MTAANTKDYIAVLDIGSNAVRLVIYDGLNRAPVKVYNERDICGLGRDLATTGRLHPEGRTRAYQTIARFSGLLRAMRITRVEAVATAALRDAGDGEAFIDKVKKNFGLTIRIVDGHEEARLAALGVMMNSIGGTGIIGDLGGGSMELIVIGGGKLWDKWSLPLGTHRLHAAKTRQARLDMISSALDTVPFLKDHVGCDFYALGGAWRTIGKSHITRTGHPVSVLDQYTMTGKAALEYAAELANHSPAGLEKIVGLKSQRALDVGVAALAMESLFTRLKPQRLVFSGTGLREGLIYDQLTPAMQRQDALIASCRKMALHLGRFDDLKGYNALLRWMAPLFSGEDAPFQRLLEASCLLSDIGWAEHEDYRAQLSFERLIAAPLYGVDHGGRAHLAVAQYVRHTGVVSDKDARPDKRAVITGLGLRVAYTLTAGALNLLEDCELKLTPKYLTLHLRDRASALYAELIEETMTDLATAIGREASVKVWK